jgi:hypothetical protein
LDVTHFIKAAYADEEVSFDRAATTPEGSDYAIRFLMNVMVKKVLVLRHEVPSRWRLIVRANESINSGVRRESRYNPIQRLGMHTDVSVHKEDVRRLN